MKVEEMTLHLAQFKVQFLYTEAPRGGEGHL